MTQDIAALAEPDTAPRPQRHQRFNARVCPPAPDTNGLPYYEWEHIVTYGETSAAGFVYYNQYFEWMGACREQCGFELFPQYMRDAAHGIVVMPTVEVSCEYLGELYANDHVVLKMFVSGVRLYFLQANIHIYRRADRGDELVARAKQTWGNAVWENGLPEPGATLIPAPLPRECVDGIKLLGADLTRAWSTNSSDPHKEANGIGVKP
ncbi:acyl-CoA thioesterase [Streptomyces sp. NRRL F-2664]|uniref:acyl-CoA thioesterase n=1 Tax=Streptomyces sp. NRRL F-2664 TaxID=1463842 RepID=UPI00131A670A|nr:acyl-CoA thioesterase [Streptomyces sp. NRRL F-2664]